MADDKKPDKPDKPNKSKEDKPPRGSQKDRYPSEGGPYDGAPDQQPGAVRGI